MNNTLLPCPFCGGKAFVATLEHSEESRPHGYRFHGQIMCLRCQATAGNTGFDATREEATRKAIVAWNRRADAAPVVRCGECDRRIKSADLTNTVLCGWLHKITMKKDDFCSYGAKERKMNIADDLVSAFNDGYRQGREDAVVRGEWNYTIKRGSCRDYSVTAKCSKCGWDWFSKDGVGNYSAVFGAFITNGDSQPEEAERLLLEHARANNKLNYCPNCGAKMESEGNA